MAQRHVCNIIIITDKNEARLCVALTPFGYGFAYVGRVLKRYLIGKTAVFTLRNKLGFLGFACGVVSLPEFNMKRLAYPGSYLL